MTAPRAREQADPPSPPDRRPPRRGGGSSPSPCTCASAAGRPAGSARPCGARRGLVRSARALAAAALLALSGALALPATAQAAVLVSNIGQSTDTADFLDVDEADQSLQFTTGGTTGDSHNLDSVEVAIEEFISAEMAVSLYSDASGVPGSSLFTFTNPTGGVTSGAVNTFTAPDNTTLTGGTPYHIVVSSPSVSGTFVRVHLERTNSDAEDDAGEDDWGIGNFGYSLSGTTWSSSSRVMKIRVNGTAAGDTPPPLSTDATLSGLTVAGGGSNLTLSPAFASGTEDVHGGGGLRHRRGDGDAGDDRRGRDVRIPRLVRRRARRRGHRHGRPPGGAGGGRERHQGQGDGRGRHHDQDLHGDGHPGDPDLLAERRRPVVRRGHGGARDRLLLDGYSSEPELRRLVRHDVLGRDQRLHD